MSVPRVWILYEPQIYVDLFKKIFRSYGVAEIFEGEAFQGRFPAESAQCDQVDVIVLPIDENGRPKVTLLPREVPGARIVAFSPDGNYGMRLLPGSDTWEEIQPFGLVHLICEILEENVGLAPSPASAR